MKHAGVCASDEYARDVCEGMHQDKVDKILGLRAALTDLRTHFGGHSPESKRAREVIDKALEEFDL